MTAWREQQRIERRRTERRLRGRLIKPMPPSSRKETARIEQLMAKCLESGEGNLIAGVRELHAKGTVSNQDMNTVLEVHRAWAIEQKRKREAAEHAE